MNRILFLYFIFIFCINHTYAECQNDDSLETILGKKGKIATLKNNCLCSIVLKQKNINKAIQLINEFANYNRMSDTLLFCLWYNLTALGKNDVATYTINAWKKKYGSISAAFSYYREKNELSKLDSLCKILDNEMMLDELHLLKWIEIKQLIKDYSNIAELTCRIIRSKVNLAYTTLDRMEMVTNEIEDSITLDKILKSLIECSKEDIDARVKNEIKWWVIDKYGRKGLYIKQIEVLIEREEDLKIRDGSLFNIAIEHLEKKRFTLARDISLRLFNITKDTSLARRAAEIVFKTYLYTGIIDSAKKWIKLSGIESEKNNTEAIEFYQKTGEYSKASFLLSSLPSSLAKDTLYLKNLLLMDSLEKAQDFIAQKNTFIARYPYYFLLWQIRVNFFSGKVEKCLSIFDSMAIEPSQLSEEVLRYKYWIFLLSESREEIELFRQIEYTLFKGFPEKAGEIFCKKDLKDKNRWKLAVYIAKKQIEFSKVKEALNTLLCVSVNNEAEYLYTLGEAYIMSGKKEEGKKILEKLVLNFSNIYSVKARQLLNEIH
ncbi:MAG: hypothetical protein N2053_05410 [Chitinispirillaceae bacterium]|nr:hypothetical protein [Chitinispirillaceae bacterium]